MLKKSGRLAQVSAGAVSAQIKQKNDVLEYYRRDLNTVCFKLYILLCYWHRFKDILFCIVTFYHISARLIVIYLCILQWIRQFRV
jgi:hypothetical protein